MNTQEKIRDILDSYVLMNLSTVTDDGLPKARSVDFARDLEDESKLYFMTFKNSAKVHEMKKNNNVFVVIDKDANSMEELSQIRYLRASGKAYQVESSEEMQKGMGLIMQKYPYLANLPGDPSMMSLFRLELNEVTVVDNNVSFNHIEKCEY